MTSIRRFLLSRRHGFYTFHDARDSCRLWIGGVTIFAGSERECWIMAYERLTTT